MRSWILSSVGLLMTLGCGSSDDDSGTLGDDPDGPAEEGGPYLDGFEPLEPSENQTQLLTPVIRDVEPGADINYCTYLSVTTDEDVNVVSAIGEQSGVMGHHALLYVARTPQEPGTHECTEADMLNANYVAAAGGGVRTENVIPEGIGYYVPAGAQFFVQSHWINGTTEYLDGQSAFNIEMRPVSDDVESASLLNVAGLDIDIPAQAPGEAKTSCTFEEDVTVFALGGHAHEWGTHVRITHTPQGEEANVLYDEPWRAEYASDAPILRYSREEPLRFGKGDTLEVECEYENTTSGALGFPAEMCLMFAYYFPGTEQLTCLDGTWLALDEATRMTQ